MSASGEYEREREIMNFRSFQRAMIEILDTIKQSTEKKAVETHLFPKLSSQKHTYVYHSWSFTLLLAI